jgi:serine/threonine protein kinase
MEALARLLSARFVAHINILDVDLVLDFMEGGDLYDFVALHNGLSELRLALFSSWLLNSGFRRTDDQTSDAAALRSARFHSQQERLPSRLEVRGMCITPLCPAIANHDLQNVLLTKNKPPVLKIADFGLAKMVDYNARFEVSTTSSYSSCFISKLTLPIHVVNLWHTNVSRPRGRATQILWNRVRLARRLLLRRRNRL